MLSFTEPYWLPGDPSSTSTVVDKSVGFHELYSFLQREDLGPLLEQTPVTKVAERIKKDNSPLLAFLPLSSSMTGQTEYNSAVLITGSNDWTRQITFHDYWLGPNRTLSFSEYKKLQESLPKSLQNFYLSIPIDDVPVLQSQEADLLRIADNSAAHFEEEVMRLISVALYADYVHDYQKAKDTFIALIDHPDFEKNTPPFYKVFAYYKLSEAYFRDGEYTKSFDYVQEAITSNVALNEPFGDWPGFEIPFNSSGARDRLSGPYRVLGDIYRVEGKVELAKEAYNKSLVINPENYLAKSGLQIIQDLESLVQE